MVNDYNYIWRLSSSNASRAWLKCHKNPLCYKLFGSSEKAKSTLHKMELSSTHFNLSADKLSKLSLIVQSYQKHFDMKDSKTLIVITTTALAESRFKTFLSVSSPLPCFVGMWKELWCWVLNVTTEQATGRTLAGEGPRWSSASTCWLCKKTRSWQIRT
eukprot:3157764-Amphidinium_carterae.1